MSTDTELTPAVIAPGCAKGDCAACKDTDDHPCEHICHVQPKPCAEEVDVYAETGAMAAAYGALAPLGTLARDRVMRWLDSRLHGEEVPF